MVLGFRHHAWVAFKRKGTGPADQEVEFDVDKIDLVTVSPEGDVVQLYIVVVAPWTGSDAQIQSLQQKIHNYVGFAADGELHRAYPETSSHLGR